MASSSSGPSTLLGLLDCDAEGVTILRNVDK
jgi:hypothetical protein